MARKSEKDDDEEESVDYVCSGRYSRVYYGHGVSIRLPFSWTWSSRWPPIKNSFAITVKGEISIVGNKSIGPCVKPIAGGVPAKPPTKAKRRGRSRTTVTIHTDTHSATLRRLPYLPVLNSEVTEQDSAALAVAIHVARQSHPAGLETCLALFLPSEILTG
ncbi:hypothetical protein ACLKA7_011794 [Drosophila subpalustris]